MGMSEPIEIFTSDSDAWDDSALIKAWDSTIDSFKNELVDNDKIVAKTDDTNFVKPSSNHVSTKKKSSKRRNKKKKVPTIESWEVGENCHAKFAEDGLYYAAEIVALCETFATVCFVDYDEEGDVMLSDLKKIPVTKSPENQNNDFSLSHGTHNSWNQYVPPVPNFSIPPPPPPPPPCPIHNPSPYSVHHPSKMGHSHGAIPQPHCPPHPFSSSQCSDESLAAMLMSWYKTGFTTGYYQALREHNIVPNDKPKT
jgi:survival motor neuron protein